jgi:hypothetical protein
VGKLIGYRRFEGIAAARALARLYGASRMFENFFQPSFKLAEKHRQGAQVTKRWLHALGNHDRLISLDDALDKVHLGGDRFFRIIDIAIGEVRSDASVAFLRPSGHPPAGSLVGKVSSSPLAQDRLSGVYAIVSQRVV